MKKLILFSILCSVFFITKSERTIIKQDNFIAKDSIPSMLLGNFKDDYEIRYTITDTVWTQHPGVKYHVIKWDTGAKYAIAKNDAANPSEKNLYSRIDYMYFTNMEPFKWGFCLTVYNAASDSIAMNSPAADREHSRKGCNGYPFSRMKRTE